MSERAWSAVMQLAYWIQRPTQILKLWAIRRSATGRAVDASETIHRPSTALYFWAIRRWAAADRREKGAPPMRQQETHK